MADPGGPSSAPAVRSADRPFAELVLTLIGWELPLSEDQQAFLLSLLGVCALGALLLLFLLLLHGLSSFFEDPLGTLCCCRDGDHTRFVVLDERTDIEEATKQALALA